MTSADLAFLEPWEPLSSDQVKQFSSELNRELTAQHPLHGLPMTPVARSKAADDVLFSMKNGQVAMVHLTWSGQPEAPPWPRHKRYPTLDAWAEQLMIPEHAEYSSHRSPPTR
jgi:hypothetical protein